jgi:hypothetical protein
MTTKKQFKQVGWQVLCDALARLGLEPRRRHVGAPMLGLVGAAAVGAVTGMFLAPRPGRETFASVKRQLKAWRK